MTRQQAIEHYLKHRVHSNRIIKILMAWDKKLSLRENSKKVGLRVDGVRNIAQLYGMDYKRVGSGGVRVKGVPKCPSL